MTSDWSTVLRALRELLTNDTTSRQHLGAWTADANLLIRQIRSAPEISNALDEVVWHFLSDADIRVKDPVYGETQRAEFERWLLQAERTLDASRVSPGSRRNVILNDENPLRTASDLAQAGRTAEAVACLEAALARTRSNKERPGNASILARTAGLFCEETGSFSQAAIYYEEAVATADRDPLPLLALASVRWRLGQADSARSCLARAESMAQSSSNADALKMVANIRAEWESNNS